jgi:Zn finger protein HypA/HybF involved in hydrogenase expression
MHEGTIAQHILEFAEQRLDKIGAQAGRPTSDGVNGLNPTVCIAVGEFRNVDPESLTLAFDAMKSDYLGLRQAVLQIELVEAKARCLAGKHEYRPRPSDLFQCPVCSSGIGTMLTGEELEMRNVKLEISDARSS